MKNGLESVLHIHVKPSPGEYSETITAMMSWFSLCSTYGLSAVTLLVQRYEPASLALRGRIRSVVL